MYQFNVGDKFVIECPIDPRNAIDGYGPNYENGAIVTVTQRSRNRPPVLTQPGLDKDGKPDPKLPATLHVWVKADEAEKAIWVQPDRIKPYTPAKPAKPAAF